MAGFYLDHNVAFEVARRLQASGHAATTARWQGLDAADDDEHLQKAAEEGWILVTHNLDDFELLHGAWLRWSKAWGVTARHAGILILPQSARFPANRLASELDRFLSLGLDLRNELYELRSTGIWYRREPTGGWSRCS